MVPRLGRIADMRHSADRSCDLRLALAAVALANPRLRNAARCLRGGVWVVWATGLGGFPNIKTLADLRDSLELGGKTTPEVILLWVGLWLTEGSVRSLASALGEAIGWSGFLAPRLAARYGFSQAALVTGAICDGAAVLAAAPGRRAAAHARPDSCWLPPAGYLCVSLLSREKARVIARSQRVEPLTEPIFPSDDSNPTVML